MKFLSFILILVCAQHIFANKYPSARKQLNKLEHSLDGKIGIFAMNTANQQTIHYRSKERFPIQSTFKLMVVAAILKKSATDPELLQKKIFYTKNDLVTWSPITEKRIDSGMSILELCDATMKYSDNTATNLLMKQVGGPAVITDFAHSLGDSVFNVLHYEAELNSNPNSTDDTSTPENMGINLKKIAFNPILPSSYIHLLLNWMKENTTGDAQIRAGVPKEWVVADKTGSSSFGTSNDIGIIWPTGCDPIIIAIYTVQNKEDATKRNDILKDATRTVINEFARADLCIKQALKNEKA
nr:ClassA_beta_lactamase [uncultured bacterium]